MDDHRMIVELVERNNRRYEKLHADWLLQKDSDKVLIITPARFRRKVNYFTGDSFLMAGFFIGVSLVFIACMLGLSTIAMNKPGIIDHFMESINLILSTINM